MKYPNTININSKNRGIFVYLVLTLAVLSTNCAAIDSMTGKTDLEMQYKDLQQQLKTYKTKENTLSEAKIRLETTVAILQQKVTGLENKLSAKEEDLKVLSEKSLTEGKTSVEEKAKLEQQLATCKAEKEKAVASLTKEQAFARQMESKFKEQIKRLESGATKGISIIFFGGDIIYEVSLDAYKSYRAGLRYRALRNVAFANEYEKFEAGKGGDAVVLGVLKEIDLSADRTIDAREAYDFRQTEESLYSKKLSAF